MRRELSSRRRPSRRIDPISEIMRAELPTNLPFVLGSSSRNRQNILSTIGWPYSVMIPDIDEKAIRSDNHLELPSLIAKAKAQAIIDRLTGNEEPFVLVTTDQVVYFQGEIREKPADRAEAARYLNSYSKNAVSTVSAVVATHLPSRRQSANVDVATVFWNEITPAVVERVIARGEIFSSAGGFRIEDPDLKDCILDIDGAVDSVMGMPIDLTVQLVNDVTLEDSERSMDSFF
jgi:septum formation protein